MSFNLKKEWYLLLTSTLESIEISQSLKAIQRENGIESFWSLLATRLTFCFHVRMCVVVGLWKVGEMWVYKAVDELRSTVSPVREEAGGERVDDPKRNQN